MIHILCNEFPFDKIRYSCCCFVEIILSILRVCTWWAQVTKLHEAKTEKSEKAGSHWESNPGHLWLELPVLEVS